MRILIASVLFVFVSCAGKSDTANTNSINDKEVVANVKGENTMKLDPNCILTYSLPESINKPILAYALKHRYDENQEDPNHATYTFSYTDDNIEFIFPVVDIWLNKKHYTVPSESVFYSRIKDVFSLDLHGSPRQVEKHDKYWIYISDLERYNDKIYTPNIGYFYFCKEGRFIYNIDLGETFVSATEATSYETCINERTYHYNNFIFSDSQSSLTWLLNNDMFFIEQLVIDFGYDKNDRINKAILDKINKEYLSKQPKQEKDLVNLFARKDSNGNLQIREGLMRFILDNTTTEDNKYLRLLESFSYTLYLSSPDREKMNESFTEEEKLTILAYATYFTQKAHDLYWKRYSRNWAEMSLLNGLLSLRNETSQKFLQQIRENNYYGLDGFEKMVNDMLQSIEDEPEPQLFF